MCRQREDKDTDQQCLSLSSIDMMVPAATSRSNEPFKPPEVKKCLNQPIEKQNFAEISSDVQEEESWQESSFGRKQAVTCLEQNLRHLHRLQQKERKQEGEN